jgi:hypothetical protein
VRSLLSMYIYIEGERERERETSCLDRGDGALLVRGNALLETTQIGGKRGLISYSRGDAAEKRRHLYSMMTHMR